MYLKKLLIFLFVTLGLNYSAIAKDYNVSQKDNKVTFKAFAQPSVITIPGTNMKVRGSLKEVAGMASGTLKVDISKLDTGIATRDEHAKKHLGFPEHKDIVLELAPFKLSSGKTPFVGKLSIKGEVQTLSGVLDITQKGSEYLVKSSFTVNLADYKTIDAPVYEVRGRKVAQVEEKIGVTVSFMLGN